MPSSDKVIQLSVKVNADTGQLEVLGAKLRGAGDSAKQAQGAFSGLAGEAGSLLKAYLPFATAGGIIAFFSNAVIKANEHAESMRRLKGDVEAAGLSFEQNKVKIIEWSEAIQAATRFDNDQAITSLERFIKATGSLTQAMRASKLAMDISVQTGKTLEESQSILIDLIAGNERGLRMANKELGAFTGGAHTAQAALDNLQGTLGGAAEKEQSFAKQASQVKNEFDDFSRTIGEALSPAVAFVIHQFSNLMKVVSSVGSLIAMAFASALHGVEGLAGALLAATTGHLARARVIALNTSKQIKADFDATEADLGHIWEKATDKQIEEALKGSKGRIDASTAANQQIEDKLTEMEKALDQKIAAIGDDTFARRRQQAAAEIEVERAKIDKEFKDEVDKNGKIVKINQDRVALMKKLGELEVKQQQQITKEEVRARQGAAIEIGDLAVQTLAVLNSMGDSHNRSAVARAKVILALEKSIAIAKAIAAAQSGGPFAAGIAAASIALITAQFAQQYKSIDQAASTSTADTGSLAGGGNNLSSPGGSSAGGGTPASALPGGSGGGGGGQAAPGAALGAANITVSIQLNLGSLDISNADALLRKIVDAAQSGTMDALSKAIGQRLVEQINGTGQMSLVRGG